MVHSPKKMYLLLLLAVLPVWVSVLDNGVAAAAMSGSPGFVADEKTGGSECTKVFTSNLTKGDPTLCGDNDVNASKCNSTCVVNYGNSSSGECNVKNNAPVCSCLYIVACNVSFGALSPDAARSISSAMLLHTQLAAETTNMIAISLFLMAYLWICVVA